jgi:hypothetical protein
MQIADGTKTVDQVRADTAERTTRTRALQSSPLRSGENAGTSQVTPERMKGAFADEGDSEETCWRRGLLYRADNAASEAAYEDWSGFSVDPVLIDAARRAAKAWTELARYLSVLRDAQSAEVSGGRQQLEIMPIVAADDDLDIPERLRREPKAAAS